MNYKRAVMLNLFQHLTGMKFLFPAGLESRLPLVNIVKAGMPNRPAPAPRGKYYKNLKVIYRVRDDILIYNLITLYLYDTIVELAKEDV